MWLGFDIGGTKLACAAVDGAYALLAPPRVIPTPRSLVDLSAAVASFSQAFPNARGAGLGIAGLIGVDGVLRYSAHVSELVGVALGPALEAACGLPFVIEHDQTVAAVAEHRLGAAAGLDDFVFVGLGTGIGARHVVGGHAVRGAHGFAGEAGHMVIDRHGAPHVTGFRGPWEMYASGGGLARLVQSAAQRGELPAGMADGRALGPALEVGDTAALGVLDDYADAVALGLANLAAVLDPQAFVIGGGVSMLGEPLRARVAAALGRHLIGAAYRPAIEVRLAALGSRAGALGAAICAAEAGKNSGIGSPRG